MKCLKLYRDTEKRREYRCRHKNKNYEKGDFSSGKRRWWTLRECMLCLAHIITDRELAKKIKRSVRAIQHKRTMLLNELGY